MKHKKGKDKGFLTEFMEKSIAKSPAMRQSYTPERFHVDSQKASGTNNVKTFLENFLNNKTAIWDFDQECFLDLKPLGKKGIAGSAYEKDGRIVKKFHEKLYYDVKGGEKYNECQINSCKPNQALYEYLVATILSQEDSEDVFENPSLFPKVYTVGICDNEFYIEMLIYLKKPPFIPGKSVF